MTVLQITQNEIISGVCRAINTVYNGTLPIYKEKEQFVDTPGVTVYCINYDKIRVSKDVFQNIFEIIINYFPENSPIIVDKRQAMFVEAEKICNAIEYIILPSAKRAQNGYIETELPCKCRDISIMETEQGFVQIAVSYAVRTTRVHTDNIKMQQIDVNVRKQ